MVPSFENCSNAFYDYGYDYDYDKVSTRLKVRWANYSLASKLRNCGVVSVVK